MRVFDVLFAWAGTPLRTVGMASVPTTRAQRGCWVDLVGGGCAGGNHLDLVFAAIHRPILSSCTDNFDLLQQIALIPAQSNLSDLVVLVEMYEVSLFQSDKKILCRPLCVHTTGSVAVRSTMKLSRPGR